MNLKGMIVSIVTATLVMAILAAVIVPASAGAADVSKVADRTECPLGGDITYTLEINNTDTQGRTWTFDVYDQYANDDEIWLTNVDDLSPGSTWPYTITFTVKAGDESNTYPGWVINNVRYNGTDSAGMPIGGFCGEPVKIIVDVNFTYAATDCRVVTVTPEYFGPVAWHQWILNGVPDPVVNAPPVDPITVTGSTNVTLRGGSNTSNYADYVEFSDTIDVAGEPTVTVKRSPPAPQCVEIGDSVTFSIASLTNDAPMDTYEWTFTNGIAGSGVLPWPPDGDVSMTRTIPSPHGTKATLTVVDELGCEGEGYVTVCVDPPQEVPLLTLPGMFALIGMMCIVGAGRILTKGRRS